VQAFRLEAEVALTCRPASFQHMAGLVFYYDSANWVYLRVTHEEGLGPCVGIDACDKGRFATLASVALGGPFAGEDIRLGGKLEGGKLAFFVSGNDGVWRALGEPYPAGKLSDEYVEGMGFTGTMVGIAAVDLLGQGWPADFRGFRYTQEAEGGYASEGAATGSEIPSRNSGLR
jgi:xylan 1,4-beta-xylosidase